MADTPYLYPGTDVLMNLRGIRDQTRLQVYEDLRSRIRARSGLPAGDFSYAHLKAIHWHLFQDVYDWAGDARIVEMVKDDTIFCPSAHVDEQMQQISDDLAAEYHLVGLAPEAFAGRAGHYLCAINAVHPFREGNGRAQRAFLGLLAQEAGHPIDWSRITPAQMRDASIAGMSGQEQLMAGAIRATITPQRQRTPEEQTAYERELASVRAKWDGRQREPQGRER